MADFLFHWDQLVPMSNVCILDMRADWFKEQTGCQLVHPEYPEHSPSYCVEQTTLTFLNRPSCHLKLRLIRRMEVFVCVQSQVESECKMLEMY